VAGRPLIAWTIEAALHCPTLNRVVVSTDDLEIAAVSRTHGAEAPFIRPAELARDDTPTMPVVTHALKWLADEEGYVPERVMLLQPTSPLRTSEDIAAALVLADERSADSVISVSEASTHPHLSKRITREGLLVDFMDHPAVERRQDLEPLYALNGAIYLARRSVLEKHSFYGPRTYAYVMPPERSLDVDTAWDLHLCDLVLRDLHARG
jgi:CMP-N,N'-diacetyllegionaminic acid synthase